jgi:hypothetical protein
MDKRWIPVLILSLILAGAPPPTRKTRPEQGGGDIRSIGAISRHRCVRAPPELSLTKSAATRRPVRVTVPDTWSIGVS